MTTEEALLLLVAILTVGALVLLAVTVQRLSGSVKLELDLGGRETERARAYARAMADLSQGAQQLRNVTPPVTQQIAVETVDPALVTATVYGNGPEVQQDRKPDPGTPPAVVPPVTR